MKKRIVLLALAFAMLLSMNTVAFAANSNAWESDMDLVNVASVGENNFATLDEAFDYQIENGEESVILNGDLTVAELEIPADGTLDLNGHNLTATTVDAIAPGAEIIDSTDGEALLVVKGDCQFNVNNPQLPVKDGNGYRFFNVNVKSVAITGRNTASPKYWFNVTIPNYETVFALLNKGAELNIQINLNLDGKDVAAKASADFVKQWAEAYKSNSGIYITATLVEADGYTTITATPAFAANGVEIKGVTM